MKICIIGGGPSGMTAAIKAAQRGKEIFIIERNSKLGKKLALTGNGRCNYWNSNQDLNKYHSSDIKDFVNIYKQKKDEVLDFFKELGIIPRIVNGYYYPFSNQAQSVVNALENKLKALKVKIIYNELVLKITKEDKFIITTDKETYYADKVVISTGGKSMAKTGSDGNGYSLADFLGHTIKKVSPSLVQVRGKDSFYKEWTGVRSEAILSLYQNDQKVKEERGEVQFTDYGISGICTFNLSGDIAQNKEMKSIIYINFVPWFQGSKDEFLKWLNNQIELLKDFSLKGVLGGFLNVKLVNLFLKLLKIENKTWQDIDKMALIELLFNFKFEVLTTNDFTDSQVTRGGIPLNEVFETLESKKTKSLYFTGEILDVDGDCGGYNLGFAWMSGLIVGDNL